MKESTIPLKHKSLGLSVHFYITLPATLSRDYYSAHVVGVNPEKGHHRNVGYYLWPLKARALALESENSVLVALDGAIRRVDVESGLDTLVASGDLLRGASGVVRMPSGEIIVTTIPDKVLKVNSTDGSTVVLSEGNLLWHPKAPTVENARSVLVGTAGGKAGVSGVLRVNLQTGAQDLVASGPFTTIAGMAIESGGSIVIADNGRGSPGDGFLARLDPITRQTTILASAQSSNWKFLNGRSIAVFPEGSLGSASQR
jgi:hypothetical protein